MVGARRGDSALRTVRICTIAFRVYDCRRRIILLWFGLIGGLLGDGIMRRLDRPRTSVRLSVDVVRILRPGYRETAQRIDVTRVGHLSSSQSVLCLVSQRMLRSTDNGKNYRRTQLR